MQKILHYNVPRLVIYENMYMQAYRNDVFTGHVEDLARYISGPWTLRNIHKLGGTPGGSVPIAISEEPDTFNIYTTNSPYAKAIMDNLWPSLYKYGPDLSPWPDLAKTLTTETHSDNAAVPDGHTRFTIDIIQNATWSDGVPLTAEDVAFSTTYAFESRIYGNPAGADVGDLAAAYATNASRVIIEFSTETYWHFSNFAFDYVIPEHIFNDETGIGYDGWETWNPVLDPAEPHVTCGPFILTDYEEGEFYKLERNPLFHYAADPITLTTTPTNSTPISSTGNTTGPELSWSVVAVYVIATSSGIIIIFVIVIIMRERSNLENI